MNVLKQIYITKWTNPNFFMSKKRKSFFIKKKGFIGNLFQFHKIQYLLLNLVSFKYSTSLT